MRSRPPPTLCTPATSAINSGNVQKYSATPTPLVDPTASCQHCSTALIDHPVAGDGRRRDRAERELKLWHLDRTRRVGSAERIATAITLRLARQPEPESRADLC